MSTIIDNTIDSNDYIYTPSTDHQSAASEGSCEGNAIAYFLEVFADSFEQATIQLQEGETELAEAFGNLLQTLSDKKNDQLATDNAKIESDIKAENDYINGGGKDNNKIQTYNNNITLDQQDYKSDDSIYTQQINIINTDNESNINLVTSISQNNSSVYQIAMSVAGIENMAVQIYNK